MEAEISGGSNILASAWISVGIVSAFVGAVSWHGIFRPTWFEYSTAVSLRYMTIPVDRCDPAVERLAGAVQQRFGTKYIGPPNHSGICLV